MGDEVVKLPSRREKSCFAKPAEQDRTRERKQTKKKLKNKNITLKETEERKKANVTSILPTDVFIYWNYFFFLHDDNIFYVKTVFIPYRTVFCFVFFLLFALN